jgi:hypothetical protein
MMVGDLKRPTSFIYGSAPSCPRLRVTRVRCKAEVGLSIWSDMQGGPEGPPLRFVDSIELGCKGRENIMRLRHIILAAIVGILGAASMSCA